MKDKSIDIIERMEILLSALYQDAQDTKNSIVFDYNPGYPRFLNFDAENFIKALENICKFFLYYTEYASISIIFHLKNYSSKAVHFNINIKSSRSVINPKQYYLNKINKYLQKANSTLLNHNDGEFIISLTATLNNINLQQTLINLKNQTNVTALIACDEDSLFDTISAQANFLGLKVIGKNDINNLMRHVTDSIFSPFIIFIESEILKDEATLNKIVEFKNLKNFKIIVICKNDQLASNLPENFIILKQPFSTDSFQLAFKNAIKNN
ncbi:hypothetical protein [Campylobacter concisus]|jgi:hypothetical protein|uniref:Uncharacterized protein n=1 Tax=Campylobacter concisus TaxID=199 RepID=A0A7S9RU81_9BACT|nr:hypothetical protein [Campylobacter concisus]QPH97994.1 hypothetical protein CVS89_06985 [Campylobacter concisus]QPI05189.1 hypothetical protein G5B99_06795 [Campylobacter concisus]